MSEGRGGVYVDKTTVSVAAVYGVLLTGEERRAQRTIVQLYIVQHRTLPVRTDVRIGSQIDA
jgi:hypothetical protein